MLTPLEGIEIYGAVVITLYVACMSDSAPPTGMSRAKLFGFILGAPFIFVGFILTSPVWGGMFVTVLWRKYCLDWAFAQVGKAAEAKDKRESAMREKKSA